MTIQKPKHEKQKKAKHNNKRRADPKPIMGCGSRPPNGPKDTEVEGPVNRRARGHEDDEDRQQNHHHETHHEKEKPPSRRDIRHQGSGEPMMTSKTQTKKGESAQHLVNIIESELAWMQGCQFALNKTQPGYRLFCEQPLTSKLSWPFCPQGKVSLCSHFNNTCLIDRCLTELPPNPY